MSSKDIKHLSIISMLYHTGYLTIDSVSGNFYTLRFPNFEIKRYMASFFIEDVLAYNNLINKDYFIFYRKVKRYYGNQAAKTGENNIR